MTGAVSDAVRLDFDATFALWREGYRFGERRFAAHDTDAFRTRVLGRRAYVLRGVDAVQFFYGEDRFDRTRLVPVTVLHSLQDERSVQTLRDAAHRSRKDVFLTLTGGDATRSRLADAFARHLGEELDARGSEPFALLGLVSRALTAAGGEWVGVPLAGAQLDARAREFEAMIDGAGSFGIRNLRGRVLRRRTERWARGVISDVVEGRLDAPLIAHLAEHTPDEDVAAIELLNLVRPVVAVARFAVFGALALHRHPDAVAGVARSDQVARAFAQEVRRTAPFFPLIGGAATRPLEWRGISFVPGDRVLVDLFATNRHPSEWVDAAHFLPGRFLDGADEERIVAQGAGPWLAGHRCPGEPATVDLLTVFLREFAGRAWRLEGATPVDLHRLPAAPGRRGMPVRLLPRERTQTTRV